MFELWLPVLLRLVASANPIPSIAMPTDFWQEGGDKGTVPSAILSLREIFRPFFCTDKKNVLHLHLGTEYETYRHGGCSSVG